ncbi:hypothetical protein M885DRAFT_440000 [Pelagophyceae sp. CCMP2097]|nr:hypothetical protein M885DRAFT_440000 [Pelagophyceae sp. CCMP2097]
MRPSGLLPTHNKRPGEANSGNRIAHCIVLQGQKGAGDSTAAGFEPRDPLSTFGKQPARRPTQREKRAPRKQKPLERQSGEAFGIEAVSVLRCAFFARGGFGRFPLFDRGLSNGPGVQGTVSTRAVSTRAVSTRAVSTRAVSTGAVSTGAVSTRGPDTKAVSTRAVSTGARSTRAVSTGAVSTRAVSTRGSDTRAVSTRAVSTRAVSTGAVSTRGREYKGREYRGREYKGREYRGREYKGLGVRTAPLFENDSLPRL